MPLDRNQKDGMYLSAHDFRRLSNLMSGDFQPKDEMMVRRVLGRYIPHEEVWAIGDRVGLNLNKHMDLELVIVSETMLPEETMRSFRFALGYSVVNLRVDAFEWQDLSDRDRLRVLRGHVIFQKSSKD